MIKDREERGSWNWKEHDMYLKENGYKPIDRETHIERIRNADIKDKQTREELEETLCQLRALKTLKERLLK